MKTRPPKVSDETLRQTVPLVQTWAELCRTLGVKGGGSLTIIKNRIAALGGDTSHFTCKGLVRKPRTRTSFVCKWCHAEVTLAMYEVPRVYCSPECVKQGRPIGIQESLTDPERRQRISSKVKQSWEPDNRAKRDAVFQNPDMMKRRKDATTRAAQEPALRLKRSENAKAKWETDEAFREKFIAASTKARRERVLVETCARKPHVPHRTPAGNTVMMRSKWERDFALWLDRQGLVWEYEPLRFVVEGRPYTPDFRVHFAEGAQYVEIHRTDLVALGDTKMEKLLRVKEVLGLSILHVGEDGIKALKKLLRMQTVTDWSIPMQQI